MCQNKTIPRVKRRDRLSIILFGHEKWDKSTIPHFLLEEQQRAVINLDELYSWFKINSTLTLAEVAKYLAEKEEWRIQDEFEKK